MHLLCDAAVYACLATVAHAADDPCGITEIRLSFVERSNEIARSEEPRGTVLAKLACIARTSKDSEGVGFYALQAIVAVSADDSEARAYLLKVIENDDVPLGIFTSACELLVYVADDATGERMLEVLFRNWPNSRWGPLFEYFIDRGDARLLEWWNRQDVEDVVRQKLDPYLKRLRDQTDESALLAAIRSGEPRVYREWYALQALRHGIEKARVREALMEHLRVLAQGKRFGSTDREFVEAMKEYGILRDADIEESGVKVRLSEGASRRSPPRNWADMKVRERRRAYYCGDE